eukprot:6341388-Karenia_brevis.AAC.1
MHVEIPLPSHRDRQILAAQDPLASAHHFHVFTRVVVPALFGVRMCANHKLMGGYQGIATSTGSVVEYTKDAGAHAHG